MLYAIMSDVHANPVAFEQALADARRQNAEKIVCLGDVVGYGPDPVEAVALCRNACKIVLMGNHDAAVAGLVRTDNFIAFAQAGVRRHSAELGDSDKAWLRKLPYLHKGREFLAVHGTLVDPQSFSYMYDPEQIVMSLELMRTYRRRIMFVGHTHHACNIVFRPGTRIQILGAEQNIKLSPKTTYIVNVGSVGYPRVDHCVTYVLYDTHAKTIEFRHLPFDFDGYVSRLEAKGVGLPLWLLDYLRERGGKTL